MADQATRLTSFELLHGALYHSSPLAKRLTAAQHVAAFTRCDGYGRMTWDQLTELDLTWDWSHVRDSSPEAIEAAAAIVRDALGAGLRQFEADYRAWRAEVAA